MITDRNVSLGSKWERFVDDKVKSGISRLPVRCFVKGFAFWKSKRLFEGDAGDAQAERADTDALRAETLKARSGLGVPG